MQNIASNDYQCVNKASDFKIKENYGCQTTMVHFIVMKHNYVCKNKPTKAGNVQKYLKKCSIHK